MDMPLRQCIWKRAISVFRRQGKNSAADDRNNDRWRFGEDVRLAG